MPAELYTYTGTDLATEVKVQFGDTGNVQITDQHILRWLNNGQRAIAATSVILEKTFVTNLLAGQASYDLNALMQAERVQSYAAVIANGVKLDYVPWQEFIGEKSTEALNETDQPRMFTEYGGIMTMIPAPNSSVVNGLTIMYVAWPADLSALTEKLTIPDRFYNALVQYVFSKALELDENFEAAAQQLDQHAAALAVESGREQQNPTEHYPVQSYEEP